ncbi:hypothetical protein [Streptomyces smyrnaeus]|nr:hypothetical protein [Streptomyces smyrnaeus]
MPETMEQLDIDTLIGKLDVPEARGELPAMAMASELCSLICPDG